MECLCGERARESDRVAHKRPKVGGAGQASLMIRERRTYGCTPAKGVDKDGSIRRPMGGDHVSCCDGEGKSRKKVVEG